MTALLLSHELYAELGIRLLYHSDGRLVVESRPVVYSERVGGGTCTTSTPAFLRGELLAA